MSSGVVDEGRWRGGTLDPPPAGWMHAVCLAAQVPKAAVAVVDSAGLRWAQVGGDVDDSVMNELGEGVVVGDVAGAAAGGAAPETAVFEACSLSKAPFVLAMASARHGRHPVAGRAAGAHAGQGLTLVHFSAQLEPCLAQENTLHTLNTP